MSYHHIIKSCLCQPEVDINHQFIEEVVNINQVQQTLKIEKGWPDVILTAIQLIFHT